MEQHQALEPAARIARVAGITVRKRFALLSPYLLL